MRGPLCGLCFGWTLSAQCLLFTVSDGRKFCQTHVTVGCVVRYRLLEKSINARNEVLMTTFTGAPTRIDSVESVQNQDHAATWITRAAASSDKGETKWPRAHIMPPRPVINPPLIATKSGVGTVKSDGMS